MKSHILTVLLCTEDTKIQPYIDMIKPTVQGTSGSISSIKVAKDRSRGKNGRKRKKYHNALPEYSPWFKEIVAQGLSKHRVISLYFFLVNCLVTFLNQLFFWHPKLPVARNTKNLTLQCMMNHVQWFWIWLLPFNLISPISYVGKEKK